jgi:hypothetical protein
LRDGTVAQPVSIALIREEEKPDPKYEEFWVVITGLTTPSEDVVLNNVQKCWDRATTPRRLNLISLPEQPSIAGKFVRVDFTGVNADEIECLLDAPIFKESFTTRIIEFENQDHISGLCTTPEHDCSADKFTAWRLDPNQIGDTEDLTAQGGEHQGEGAVSYVAPGRNVRLRWQSVSKTSERDILLVIIGSLIALGAAVLLEAGRPLVDCLIDGSVTRVVRSLLEILVVQLQRHRAKWRRGHSKS